MQLPHHKSFCCCCCLFVCYLISLFFCVSFNTLTTWLYFNRLVWMCVCVWERERECVLCVSVQCMCVWVTTVYVMCVCVSDSGVCSVCVKPKLFDLRQNSFFSLSSAFFLFVPLAYVPNVYVCAWMLCCFHSCISTETFQRVLTASVDSCAEIESAPSVA